MSAEQNVIDAPIERRSGHESGEDAGEDFSQGGQTGGGYELDENGQRVPHGMGQSKSSRRRRRKRKSKGEGGETGAGESVPVAHSAISVEPAAPAVVDGNVLSSVQAGAPAAQRREEGGARGPRQSGAMPQGGNGAAPGGTKRWKKKFRDRERGPRTENPGNQQNGSVQNAGFSNGNGNGGSQFRGQDTHQPGNGGGFKRKTGGFGGKQQQKGGARGFVGPMDHSYRAVNGNFAEMPPSTMEPYGSFGNGGGGGQRRGGYQGDSQPIDYSQGRAVPIAADAPTHIYFFIEDLFITAKIQETARKLGVKVAFVKNDKESVAALTAGEEADKPSLIVFDLNNANAKPMTLIPKLKTKLKKTVSIIGFLSHLQGDLKAKAMESGCDTVMPRAAFSQNLPNLLRRYGIEDTEEANYNQ